MLLVINNGNDNDNQNENENENGNEHDNENENDNRKYLIFQYACIMYDHNISIKNLNYCLK